MPIGEAKQESQRHVGSSSRLCLPFANRDSPSSLSSAVEIEMMPASGSSRVGYVATHGGMVNCGLVEIDEEWSNFAEHPGATFDLGCAKGWAPRSGAFWFRVKLIGLYIMLVCNTMRCKYTPHGSCVYVVVSFVTETLQTATRSAYYIARSMPSKRSTSNRLIMPLAITSSCLSLLGCSARQKVAR